MTCKKGTLIVIIGPTGSGKTDLSIEIARRFRAPIISTDSRQVFRGMAIGTAQPSAEQLAAACHYFVADRDVSDEYNAGRFESEALTLLDELFIENDYVVAVGGSGLYVDALCNGMDNLPGADPESRAKLDAVFREKGIGVLLEELSRIDPEYYQRVDRSNPARIMRALEVCLQTGKPYSSLRTGNKSQRPFKILKLGVDMPREELYDRINRRVDIMIAEGMEAEAKSLYHLRTLNALQTVGYKEMFAYFDGDISFAEAVELIKRNSRRYAKRQMTWFRRDADIQWVRKENINFTENFIKKFAE